MATIVDVLGMLIPNGGYIAVGDTYEGIEFIDCDPITKEQFEAGFAQYDAWKAEQEAIAAEKKQAILDKLGLTAEELTAIL